MNQYLDDDGNQISLTRGPGDVWDLTRTRASDGRVFWLLTLSPRELRELAQLLEGAQ